MKKLLTSAAIILLLLSANSSFANETPITQMKAMPHEQLLSIAKKPLLAYFWILYGPCLQLVRLNDPGYTDAQGVYHAGYSLTFMAADNYIGTNQICPPQGEYYC